jgi:hypothetical protein
VTLAVFRKHYCSEQSICSPGVGYAHLGWLRRASGKSLDRALRARAREKASRQCERILNRVGPRRIILTYDV